MTLWMVNCGFLKNPYNQVELYICFFPLITGVKKSNPAVLAAHSNSPRCVHPDKPMMFACADCPRRGFCGSTTVTPSDSHAKRSAIARCHGGSVMRGWESSQWVKVNHKWGTIEIAHENLCMYVAHFQLKLSALCFFFFSEGWVRESLLLELIRRGWCSTGTFW